MITNLTIDSLGVIKEADLEFGPGLIVFSGETGAGKTMIVNSLGLLLGDRADHSLASADQARVTAYLRRNSLAPTSDADANDEDIVVTRTIGNRSRASWDGEPTTSAQLAQQLAGVVQRYSQHDHHALTKTSAQRDALDSFAGAPAAAALAEYRRIYDEYVEHARELQEQTQRANELEQEKDRLQSELVQWDQLDPQPGEDTQIGEQLERMGEVDHVRSRVNTALAALLGETEGETVGILGHLTDVRSAVEDLGDTEPTVDSWRGTIIDSQDRLAELSAELRQYLSKFDLDPSELAQLHERKAALTALARRHGGSIDNGLEWAASARARLAELQAAPPLSQLRQQVADDVAELTRRASDLSGVRLAAAEDLARMVTEEIQQLSMPTAQFEVAISRKPYESGLLVDGRRVGFNNTGVDQVTFLLRSHPAAPAVELGKGASGGEVSRVMLGLQVVLAASSPPSVFLFDEIDAGIGGQTAIEIGRRLRRLAAKSQVFVVTHLAQVAAFADQHFVISRNNDGQVTSSSVQRVEAEDRQAELTRMLSGMTASVSGREHAIELIDLADKEEAARL